MDKYTILNGDCKDILKTLPDNHVHSVVTDPPYGLTAIGKRVGKSGMQKKQKQGDRRNQFKRLSHGFINQEWDGEGVETDPALWKELFRVLRPGGFLLSFAAARNYHLIASTIEEAGFEIVNQICWIFSTGFPKNMSIGIDKVADKETAKKWDGWANSFKPAMEPICMARKKISEKNVAHNIIKWGTGALNVGETAIVDGHESRLPTNFIHDGSKEVLELLPRSAHSFFHCAKPTNKERDYGTRSSEGKRNNNHPTVKPISLMGHLVKMVTKKEGIVLDPFMGSGSTGVAAVMAGRRFIGIEREKEYYDLSMERINRASLAGDEAIDHECRENKQVRLI